MRSYMAVKANAAAPVNRLQVSSLLLVFANFPLVKLYRPLIIHPTHSLEDIDILLTLGIYCSKPCHRSKHKPILEIQHELPTATPRPSQA